MAKRLITGKTNFNNWECLKSVLERQQGYATIKDNTISVTIQDGGKVENGDNGTQITALMEIALEFITYHNNRFPCDENKETIKNLRVALGHQYLRTMNRINRGVEGKDEE